MSNSILVLAVCAWMDIPQELLQNIWKSDCLLESSSYERLLWNFYFTAGHSFFHAFKVFMEWNRIIYFMYVSMYFCTNFNQEFLNVSAQRRAYLWLEGLWLVLRPCGIQCFSSHVRESWKKIRLHNFIIYSRNSYQLICTS